MCRANDVAGVMIKESIKLRDSLQDDRYYLDFYKLNKLMYIAQGISLSRTKRIIFNDDILAYKCGPYIKALEYVFLDWGFDPISEEYQDTITLPPDIKDILVEIIKEYGVYDRHTLGLLTKSQNPWKEHYVSDEEAQVIPVSDICKHFLENDLRQELENVLQKS